MRISDWSSDVCSSDLEISARSRRSEFIGIVKAKGCCSRFEQLGAFDGDSSFLQGRVQAVEVNRCRLQNHSPMAARRIVAGVSLTAMPAAVDERDRKSTRLNSSH